MRGEVVAVKVQPGDDVTAGQVVAVLSAMKMEMAVQSNMAGKVNQLIYPSPSICLYLSIYLSISMYLSIYLSTEQRARYQSRVQQHNSLLASSTPTDGV